MKIEFKLAGVVRSIEGDEAEIVRVLTELGVIQSRECDEARRASYPAEREADIAQAEVRDLKLKVHELQGAMRVSADRREAATNKLEELGYECVPHVNEAGWKWVQTRAAPVRAEDESARLAEKVLLKMGWHYRAPVLGEPAQWYRRASPARSVMSAEDLRRRAYNLPPDLRAASAVATLREMNFTHTDGATRWKAPSSQPVYNSSAWTGR